MSIRKPAPGYSYVHASEQPQRVWQCALSLWHEQSELALHGPWCLHGSWLGGVEGRKLSFGCELTGRRHLLSLDKILLSQYSIVIDMNIPLYLGADSSVIGGGVGGMGMEDQYADICRKVVVRDRSLFVRCCANLVAR